jgi:capsular polysaccharide export protein
LHGGTDGFAPGHPRLIAATSGLLWPSRPARILALAGTPPRPGLPGPQDAVAVWGASPTAWRGEWLARRTGATLWRIEDAFLRSVLPGRAGRWRRSASIGLLVDRLGGVHFDPTRPSTLETMLADHPLDDRDLRARASRAMARLAAAELSKYSLHDAAQGAPEGDYVLVVDQTAGDASVRASGATAATFRTMLAAACAEHPGCEVLIRPHPETLLGLRPGHYGAEDLRGRVRMLDTPASPQAVLAGARAVYAVSSQLGFEAILAGHRPHLFGAPFYAGWGLCEERHAIALPRRGRALAADQLFAAAMILAPLWYDPCRDQLCTLEEAIDQLEAEARVWREDRAGHVAVGMRRWKRRHLRAFFGRHGPVRYESDSTRAVASARAAGCGVLVWAAREPPDLAAAAVGAGVALRRVEDGIIRSRGLGAALVPPLSLVADPLGIHFDPTRESMLERLIAAPCPPGGAERATALIARIVAGGISKYNTGSTHPALPEPGSERARGRRRILVPGQVEDDASVRLGGGTVRGNLGLLAQVRAQNPDAFIIYKPHPDVEARLRRGAVPDDALAGFADLVLPSVGADAAIALCDEVWTLTSTLGFEALLRGKAVCCLGAPFYAGWGLTRDLAPVPARRRARPTLADLAHAVLIAYPRYLDPVSGLPCPPEVILERLASPDAGRRPVGLRIARAFLAGLQAAGIYHPGAPRG